MPVTTSLYVVIAIVSSFRHFVLFDVVTLCVVVRLYVVIEVCDARLSCCGRFLRAVWD